MDSETMAPTKYQLTFSERLSQTLKMQVQVFVHFSLT